MSDVILKNVYKVFDDVTAVNNFSMEIKDKEFIVFVGPSGCGKTTTLRMIAGLEKITAGEVYIGDKLVNFVQPKDRDIAMVFQNYALYPHMTVYKNMAFSLKMRKFPDEKKVKKVNKKTGEITYETKKVMRKLTKNEIDQKVREAARLLEIEDYLQRKPKALSGGQRQRVAIGRAIVRNPKVFLMDEPLSNLDAKLRNQMRAELILLRQRINTTFIYVTHDQTEAMTLGDRIVIMKDGFIQQIGTPNEVFNHPKNIFVASFIGTPQMNLFDTKVNKDGTVTINETSVSLNPELKLDSCVGKDVVLGIRPEHMKICKAEDQNAVKGVISVVESMGSSIHLHIDIGDVNNVIIIIPTAELSAAELVNLKYGNDIYVKWEPQLSHLFDSETTNNFMN